SYRSHKRAAHLSSIESALAITNGGHAATQGWACLRFGQAVETSQCEAQDCNRIYRDLRFGSLLLRTSQLASAVVRNNNRPTCRRKITKEIVDLSRGQADQNLSNRARS